MALAISVAMTSSLLSSLCLCVTVGVFAMASTMGVELLMMLLLVEVVVGVVVVGVDDAGWWWCHW